jgi:hypothetical protein
MMQAVQKYKSRLDRFICTHSLKHSVVNAWVKLRRRRGIARIHAANTHLAQSWSICRAIVIKLNPAAWVYLVYINVGISDTA